MNESRIFGWPALAASLGTLVCCALPSLFVLLGFGSTVAAVVSAAPWLVVLSQNKGWVFLGSGLLIVGSRLYVEYIVPRVTPDGAACSTGIGRLNRTVWLASVALYLLGLFVAYALGPLLAAWA